MLSFFQQKTEKKSTDYPLKNLTSRQRTVCMQAQCYQIYKSGASHKCKWTLSAFSDGGWESKQISQQLLLLRHLIITLSGSLLPPLSYSNSESQKSRYDISTNKAGHGEQIDRCTSKPRAATNCVLWILTKERRRKGLGGTEVKKWRTLLSSSFSFIFLYDAHSKALKDKNTSMYMFPQVRDHIELQ